MVGECGRDSFSLEHCFKSLRVGRRAEAVLSMSGERERERGGGEGRRGREGERSMNNDTNTNLRSYMI